MSPDDIRDIRGPIAIPYWWLPFAVALAVAAALALSFAAYRYVKQRKRERARTAAEVALARIERARALLASGASAEFSAEVSDAVRVYIEARFAMPAPHRTTEEFLRDLGGDRGGPIQEHAELLGAFLAFCDLAKFARFNLAGEQGAAMADSARRFVLATSAPPERPRSHPEPSAHGALA